MILIILPVKNGEEVIHNVVNNIYSWCKEYVNNDFEILIIDDWSTDGTIAAIDGKFKDKVRIFKNRFDNGKGSALKTGFILSNLIYSFYDYDNIVFMDSDGQISPSEIKMFLNLMNLYEADVVIGNKRHTFSSTDYPFIRRIISKTYNLLVRILFGISYQDTQCGIKVFKKRALDSVIDKVNVKQYAFDLELIVALKEMKLRVIDAPVKIRKQENVGSVSLKAIIKTLIDTLIVWVKKEKGYYGS